MVLFSVPDRATPEALEVLGPWAANTNASQNVVRWFVYGKSLTLTAPPADTTGAAFAGWYGGCDSTNNASRTCTVAVNEGAGRGVEARYVSPSPGSGTFLVTVVRAGSGVGTVTGTNPTVNCGTVCTASVAASANIALTATPSAGSLFSGWANCPLPNSNVCSFSVTSARTVTANFVPAVTLTVAKIGTGLVTSALGAINCGADCSAVLASGTSVTLTASNVAGSGYVFSSWSNCPITPSGATCGPFTISANQSVTATFTPSTAQCVFSASPTPSTVAVGSGGTGYSVTLSSPVGCAISVSNSNTSACVTNVVSTMPGTGSTVLSIVVNSTTSARSCTIGVTGLSGSYVFNQSAPTAGTVYTITRQVATNGTVGNSSGGFVGSLVCPTGDAAAGAVCSVSATANGGYAFSGWTENGTTVSASASYSFTVTGNRTLTANFVTSVSYVSYAVDVSGPLEARLKVNNSWYMRPDTGPTSALLQVGNQYFTSCATMPNWQLTGIYNPSFIAVASPPGLVQCQYQQTVPYLSLAQSSQPRFAAGYYNSMARTSDGKVYTWGIGQDGALGNGGGAAANGSALPVRSGSFTTVVGVYSQEAWTQRALLTDGTVMSWGGGGSPGLGNGTGVSGSSAYPVVTTDFGVSIRKIVGRGDTYILRTNGSVSKFSSGVTSPVAVPANVVDITARSSGVHALDAQGRVWALTFGYSFDTSNQGFQTGVTNYFSADNTQASYTDSVPMLLPGLTRIIALTESGDNTFALRDDGTVWVWGTTSGDALGSAAYPHAYPNYEPATIPGLSNIKSIVGGNGFVLALDASGNVWTWGSNSAGQLGRAAGASSATVGQVNGLSAVMVIAAGRVHAMALKTDGTLWAWGDNAYGKLGDGTTTSNPVPVQIKCPSGFSGYLNLLSDGCAPNATNLLSIAAYVAPANLPAATRVVVNGTPVSPPYQVSLPSNSTVTLDITAPTGFAGTFWRGDIDTGATNVVQLSLPMNRDWSLIPNVAACQFGSFNDSNQPNIPASGTTFSPNVSVPVGAFGPKPIVLSRCAWDAIPGVPWLRASPASGSGSPIVTTVTVDANLTNVQRTGTMLIGGATYTFVQLPGAADSVPNTFAFTAASQIPISTTVISNSVTISGVNVTVPVSITGGGEYSVNGGAYSNAASTLNLGDTVTVRLFSSSSYSTLTSTVLTIGGISATFSVTTVSAPIATNGSCGSANGGVFASAPSTNLCVAGTAMAVTGTGPWTWSCTGANGGSTASCSAAVVDTTPDAFSFAPQSAVALNTTTTSNTVTITGINSAAPISVVGGTYSIGCTATFTSAAATITNGQSACVRHTSSAANSTAVTTALTVGGVQGTFISTTVAGQINSYAVAGSAAPLSAGSVTLSPSGGSYSTGTNLTFTATPASGYLFSNWSGSIGGTQNPLTITISSSALSAVANFVPVAIAAPCPSGSVDTNPANIPLFTGTTFLVGNSAGCALSITSDSSWFRIVAITREPSSTTLKLTMAVDINTGTRRTATITIRDSLGNVLLRRRDTEPGPIASTCTYTVSDASSSFAAASSTANPTLNTQSGCAWTVISEEPWMNVSSNATGIGGGIAPTIDIAANTEPVTFPLSTKETRKYESGYEEIDGIVD